jgi:lipid A ethanolaminephosphotransferase
MGETARADRFSLNGYARDTNRYTRSLDIVNFDSVSACGTSTADSVPCVFSRLERSDFTHARFAQEESLLNTLDRLGIQTFWRDNSTGCKHVCIDEDFEQLATADDPAFCNDTGCFDELLLEELNGLIEDDRNDHFIVFHQRGSHGPAYFSDTPEWSKAFLPECERKNLRDCSLETINNAYDNTIVYTDFFLAQIIERLQHESDRYDTAMFYVSDHGESLGEKGLYLHGLPYSFAPDEQTQVPMIFWGSPGFFARNELESRCIGASAKNPTSHDAIFHTV